MADTQTDYGVAHFYGLYDTVGYMTVQSDSLSTTYKLDVEVADELGIGEERRRVGRGRRARAQREEIGRAHV